MNGYPDTWSEAKETGSQFYDTGKPCKYGHLSPRYAGNKNCVECRKERTANEMPEERAWRDMKNRCYNPNHKQYKDYGGRGVKVEEYLWNFENFFNCIGPKPSKNHELNRIDNDGHYERGNIEWTTRDVNNQNQRKREDNTSGIVGVCWHKANGKWMVQIGVNGKQKTIGYYDTLHEAQLARREAEIHYWGEDMVKTPHPDEEEKRPCAQIPKSDSSSRYATRRIGPI